mgnify:CR=1 FL=1
MSDIYETNNNMANVAELLGVKLGENFRIISDISFIRRECYRLTEKGLEIVRKNEKDNRYDPEILTELLTGRHSVDCVDWEPKKGDYFYTPNIHNPSPELRYSKLTWEGSDQDLYLFKNGLAFKEKEAAVYTAERILDQTRAIKESFFRFQER